MSQRSITVSTVGLLATMGGLSSLFIARGAVMAQALDQDTTKALTQTAQWQAYLESRRKMERTRADLEKFVQAMSESDQEQAG